MEACGQEGRGPTWAVAPTRRISVVIPHKEKYVCWGRCCNGIRKEVYVTIVSLPPVTHFILCLILLRVSRV